LDIKQNSKNNILKNKCTFSIERRAFSKVGAQERRKTEQGSSAQALNDPQSRRDAGCSPGNVSRRGRARGGGDRGVKSFCRPS